jgi:hypothetical protein
MHARSGDALNADQILEKEDKDTDGYISREEFSGPRGDLDQEVTSGKRGAIAQHAQDQSQDQLPEGPPTGEGIDIVAPPGAAAAAGAGGVGGGGGGGEEPPPEASSRTTEQTPGASQGGEL